MPTKLKPLPPTAPNPQLVAARAEGLTLLSPLRPLVDRLTINDDTGYLQADALLARLRQARILWATKLDPIRGPIDRAMAELKLSLVGIKDLDGAVDGPLLDLENRVKMSMRGYKIKEAQQIEDNRRAQEQEAQRLRNEAAKKEASEQAAKTPQMKAKLAQARADLEVKAQMVEQDTSETTAIKGASSNTRTVTKIRISDVDEFLQALLRYAPKAGIYMMNHPPMTILTHHTGRDGSQVEDGSALDKMTAEVAKIYAMQPGVVKSWPGVEEFTDVIIASR